MTRILVVGAGPVGLFTSLRLAHYNFGVELVEKLTEISVEPRAAGYYGPTIAVMKMAGIYEDALEEGYIEHGLLFRSTAAEDGKGGKTFGREIGYLKDKQLMLPQSKLAGILERKALATGKVKIHYGKEVVALEQTDADVTLTTKDARNGELEKFTGAYIVGADGGRSTVRSLAGIKFPGHTWPERMIATDVVRVNDEISHVAPYFVVDPNTWSIIIPLSPPALGQKSLWRYGMGVNSTNTLSDEELLKPEYLATLYEQRMVGSRPLQYEVQKKTVYHIHQRLATTMRRGRCFLAGDAAHLCNPVGAMGLSTGILDGEALSDTLAMVLNEGYPTHVLDIYSDLRREVFGFFVDPLTTQNKLRLASNADDAEREDGFLRMLRNPAIDSAGQFEKLCNERWRTNMRAKVASFGIKPEK